MTVKEAWQILEPHFRHGEITEYVTRVKNGRIIQCRNYEGWEEYPTKISGVIPLAPSPEMEDTDWMGINTEPGSLLAEYSAE